MGLQRAPKSTDRKNLGNTDEGVGSPGNQRKADIIAQEEAKTLFSDPEHFCDI